MHPKHETYTNLSNWLDTAKLSVAKVIKDQPNHPMVHKAKSVHEYLERETKRHEKAIMAKEEFPEQTDLKNVADIVNDMDEQEEARLKVEAAYDYLRAKELIE